jgi:surfeit locus 1 family protein
MFYHHYQFKPRLLPSLAVLMLLPFLLSLGFWQLGRMEEKQDIIENMAAGKTGEAVAINADFRPDEYSKVKVLGKFLPQFSILLEHQLHNGNVGYHVLTPFAASDDHPWLLINRGWISKDDVLKSREPLDESLDLTGLAYYPSENRFILGENFSKTPDGELKIQHMDFAGLEQELHHSLYPFVLLLDPNAPAGFVRDWEIKTMPPSKHLGYAVQWFALAATLLIIYLFTNLKRKSAK